MRYSSFEWDFYEIVSAEYANSNRMFIRHIEMDKEAKVNDFESLKKDKEFTNWLSGRRVCKKDLINSYKNIIDETKKLSGMIERELARRH